MSIHIHAIGDKLPKWIDMGITEYLRRIASGFTIHMHSYPTPKRQKNSLNIEKLKEKEHALLTATIKTHSHFIVLDEKGKSFSTEQFTHYLAPHLKSDLHFALGGPDGHAQATKNRANLCLSLSSCTLTHAMARLVLVEQIYRAITITQNHPYHRP